jgi:hypothetical protein
MSAPLALNYNIDCLAPVPGTGQLLAGLSNFIGPRWTGGLALLAPGTDGGPLLQHLVADLKTGVPSAACLPVVDEFTGGRALNGPFH